MLKTVEFKLYPSAVQAATLDRWMHTCCWVYNQALEHRIKSYKRRRQSERLYSQQALLTEWRARIDWVREVPVEFARGALRRIDRGMEAFFRRVKAGENPGFPRFRSHRRFNSIECLEVSRFAAGGTVRVPRLGRMRCRGQKIPNGQQRLLRIIRRASGWFGQVLIDDGAAVPAKRPIKNGVGIDVGLAAFASLSTGEQIANPRWLRQSARKLRAVQRRVSRRVKGSRNRRRAIRALQRTHERIAAQRRNFCHQHSTALVRRFDLIAVENLNVKGLARSRLAKSILDAAWSTFTTQLERKAEYAGATLVKVDPRGTSQECPGCGAPSPKTLSERTHECQTCGLRCDRDVAAARVILSRAEVNWHVTPAEESTAGGSVTGHQVVPMKQEDLALGR